MNFFTRLAEQKTGTQLWGQSLLGSFMTIVDEGKQIERKTKTKQF